jgi:hypothetical protein
MGQEHMENYIDVSLMQQNTLQLFVLSNSDMDSFNRLNSQLDKFLHLTQLNIQLSQQNNNLWIWK